MGKARVLKDRDSIFGHRAVIAHDDGGGDRPALAGRRGDNDCGHVGSGRPARGPKATGRAPTQVGSLPRQAHRIQPIKKAEALKVIRPGPQGRRRRAEIGDAANMPPSPQQESLRRR